MKDREAIIFHNRPFNVGLTDTLCPTLTLECSKMPGMTVIIKNTKKWTCNDIALTYIDGESIKENPSTSNALCTPEMNDPPVVVFTERAGKAGGGQRDTVQRYPRCYSNGITMESSI